MQFPNESKEYRKARNRLLKAEIQLRAQVEAVAAHRRALPPGGEPQDYVFEEGATDLANHTTTRKVKLSQLFDKGKDTLVLYSLMYGPKAKSPCPMCTAILDSLDRTAPHARQRVSLAVVAKSPIERIRAFARGRGWANLRFVSAANNDYQPDYGGETPEGNELPALNVFTRAGKRIHHAYNTEMLYAPAVGGIDARHVDMIWPLWNLFDFTPIGRGTDWYPALAYKK